MNAITKENFGTTKLGEKVTRYCIINSNGMKISVLDYGCTITEIHVPDKKGFLKDVCLGYDTIEEYEDNNGFFGAVVGRHANRIQKGEFELNGKIYKLALNNGPNHLHGGMRGFDKYVWDSLISEDSVIFTRTSLDGEEGYPGNLQLKITYFLTQDNTLKISYEAESDADTVVNLTNHAYYNLNGHGIKTVLDHTLQIFAENFTENDENGLTTGQILPVEKTPFDFLQPKLIGRDIAMEDIQLKNGRGYDHNWVLSDNNKVKKAAQLYSPNSGISLTIHTTLPGIQIYSGNGLHARTGKNNKKYEKHGGICLETQFFPNGMACKNFPSPILKKGEQFQSATEYCFEIK